MKKLLIATAALAMVAGTAQAQSSVTVYGIVDINYNSTDRSGTGGARATAQGADSLATSRLGFRGTEDLGGGLKAEFQLESRINPTNGKAGAASEVLFNRESWAGFSSAKLGSIRLGLTDVTSAQGFDTTVSQMGDLGNTSGDIGADKGQTVRYTTPTFNGITAEVGYSNGSATTNSTTDATAGTFAMTGKISSAAIKYEQGKLGLYAGQSEAKITATYDRTDTFLGAKYDFGFASVGLAYRELEAMDAAGGTDAAFGKSKQTVLSVAAPVSFLGAGVKAHAAYHKTDSATGDRTVTTASATALGVADSKKTTLALTKAFSKRTTGYAAYINTNLDAAAEADTKATIVGVTHVF
jgi:predicted porin